MSYVDDALGFVGNLGDQALKGLIDAVCGNRSYSYNTYYNVSSLDKYLLTAYDPISSFDLGEIKVAEKIKTRRKETSCDLSPTSINTWYGNFNYSDPNIIKQYFLTVDGGDEESISEDEYKAFGYSDLEKDYEEPSSKYIERIDSSKSLNAQYIDGFGKSMDKDKPNPNPKLKVEDRPTALVEVHTWKSGSNNMTNVLYETKPGKNNIDHFNKWTAYGLYSIGIKDGGTKSKELDKINEGSDFVYLYFRKEKIQKYKVATKIKREVLDESSVQITTVAGTIDRKLEEFLELLKNATGKIPTEFGTNAEGGFQRNGKVVIYEDIYKGKIPAGDLLLDNGAEMLFELLKTNTKTQGLVNVFKYLAFKYTGVSHGVTNPNQLKNLFYLSTPTGSGSISLITPTLSREDFIKAMQEYNGGANYDTYFKPIAGDIYDWGIKYGVNPELVVSMAKKEQGFKPPSPGNYNFWGLDTPNGAAPKQINSFEEGVKRLSETFATYMPGGSYASLISQRKNERSAANCNVNGYGDPGTLAGMLSVYSDLCGSDTKHREGSWGSGGNIYLKLIYGADFQSKCGNVHRLGIDDYTIQEKADYTAYLYQNQLNYWTEIFGKYATVFSGGDFLQLAQSVWTEVVKENPRYSDAGDAYPYLADGDIDCSAYVSWVLYEYGYDEFKNQRNCATLIATDWNKKYGWTEIPIDSSYVGDKILSILQPGDILVRTGHTQIIAEIKPNGDVYVFDCGGSAPWRKSVSGEAIKDPNSKGGFYNHPKAGKIIRPTPPR